MSDPKLEPYDPKLLAYFGSPGDNQFMIFESETVKIFLKDELERRIQANGRYSQRAFAKYLKLSPGELSEILRDVRPVTDKVVFKVSKAMGLSPIETNHLLKILQREKAKHLGMDLDFVQTEPLNSEDMSHEFFEVVAEWQHFAIYNLMEITGFRWNSSWISKRIDVPIAQVRAAMGRLMKVGLVSKVNDKFIQNKKFIFSPDGVPSEAIRRYHRTMLSKAIEAIDTQSVDRRDVTGVSISTQSQNIPAIKKEVREFVDQIFHRYGKGKGADVVVHLESALFEICRKDPINE